jgi:hypothetical protein
MEKCYRLGGSLARPIGVFSSSTTASMALASHTPGMLEQANKLRMHYGCCTALGAELQTSLELLVVDLGLSFQPFQVSYKHFGD